MKIVFADQIASLGDFESIPGLIAVDLFLSLIAVPISAMILRKAISMFNEAAAEKTQKIKFPTLPNAIWISLIVTLSIQAVLILAAFILIPVADMTFYSGKNSQGYYILLAVSSVVLAFFTYSKVLSMCWPINSANANSIVAIDFVIRFMFLLILGVIALVLKSLYE
ncbi:hypothetical protein [Gimesia maris]|uniref:hypothetical protein n=1 Tax=Gimesia maris TaxID=122 RepID=UPI003A918695